MTSSSVTSRRIPHSPGSTLAAPQVSSGSTLVSSAIKWVSPARFQLHDFIFGSNRVALHYFTIQNNPYGIIYSFSCICCHWWCLCSVLGSCCGNSSLCLTLMVLTEIKQVKLDSLTSFWNDHIIKFHTAHTNFPVCLSIFLISLYPHTFFLLISQVSLWTDSLSFGQVLNGLQTPTVL